MRRFAALGLLTITLGTAFLDWWGHSFLQGVTYLGRDDVFMQKNAHDCGAAALEMVFSHHRITVAYEELLSELHASANGASMLSLQQAAQRNGLPCEGWRLSFAELRRAPLPAILFIRRNHFAVLDSFTAAGEPVIRDPACGKLRYSPRRLQSIWRGETLLFAIPKIE